MRLAADGGSYFTCCVHEGTNRATEVPVGAMSATASARGDTEGATSVTARATLGWRRRVEARSRATAGRTAPS